MRRILSLFSVLILALSLICAERPAAAASSDMTVGIDVPYEDITDFYYTYDASTNPPHYQRYRFYVEDGKRWFYHETREGGGWPQTEADITCSGMIELTDEQWNAFCDLLSGGIARQREEALDDGDAGPWLFIYWTGGEKDGREFIFAPRGTVLAFEEFCEGLREEGRMRISVSGGSHIIDLPAERQPFRKELVRNAPAGYPVG